GRPDLLDNPAYATNESRIDARGTLIPELASILQSMTLDEAVAVCEQAQIPFSPINRPEDLLDDPHLRATDGLLETTLPNGVRSEEHTSELQSRENLVCRLLLEKKTQKSR